MSYWKDRVVLIPGGSLGLGRAVAGCCAKRGARIALAARGKESLDAAAKPLRKAGCDVATFVADLTSDSEVEHLFAQVRQRFGRLDALIQCAGRSSRGKILDTSAADFQSMWNLNFLGAVRCVRAAAPLLLNSRGHVVLIGSLASKTAAPSLGPYPASKFPLAAYAQQLRLELGPQGLHALLVCPGPIAREDSGVRYEEIAADLPESARLPGGGAKVKAIEPNWLAEQILIACEKRKPELIVPAKARLLFVASQISARLGDWLLRKNIK